ncbi:MAG: 4Fe-4S double cluster binding domain-containing protein [Desulfobacterales bacterium]|jgi:epoxyqueuosine reductase
MNAKNITNAIDEQLKQEGCKGKIISIEHVRDLQMEIEGHYQNGRLDQELYDGYLDRFDFNISENFNDAKSLIIVSAPQPHVRVAFTWQGQTCPGIIPSTYRLDTDHQIKEMLERLLIPEGFHLEEKRLPHKLVAVRSGLARYGKNNITYVPGMGSLHRLVVFASDLSCAEDHWGEAKTLKTCDECTACMDACPTDAIVPDRFLIHAERCITFHNERQVAFPKWLDPCWHNCLVGCLYCQNACPMNQKILNWIEDGAVFSEKETDYLVKGVMPDNMPKTMVEKLEKLGMKEYAGVLGRNLQAIMENQ